MNPSVEKFLQRCQRKEFSENVMENIQIWVGPSDTLVQTFLRNLKSEVGNLDDFVWNEDEDCEPDESNACGKPIWITTNQGFITSMGYTMYCIDGEDIVALEPGQRFAILRIDDEKKLIPFIKRRGYPMIHFKDNRAKL